MSTSFGSLPRKEIGMPGLTGGIWSVSSQKRGSFKLSDAAKRNAGREARLGVTENTHSALRMANTPSPAASEGAAASLPFAIPLQPTPKAHRSLSHSQGQRETPQASSVYPNQGSGGRALPMGLLAEDNETDEDEDSDFGGHLTHTVSHPPIGALQRAATYSAAYEDRLQVALSNLSIEAQPRRSQWESHLGWTDLPRINESRRHSLADIPTRRGSFSEDGHNGISRPTVNGQQGVDRYNSVGALSRGGDYVIAEDPSGLFDVPTMYKVPFVEIKHDELTADDLRRVRQQGPQYGTVLSNSRPRKLLFIVSFKCSRVLVFYLLEGTGLQIREGDIVIVEADRGQDLGTVQHANVTPDQARLYLRKYAEEQYKWLMMFSVNNAPSNINPNAQLYGESSAMAASRPVQTTMPPTMQGMPRENLNNLKPKAIKRLANAHEIKMLAEKEGNEAKAKRTCQQKVAHLHLQMEILDAEWQWDFQKLIFYYYADHYIDFKPLVTELYRIYKTRIWMSAVNPASFSQHAMGQPPSGVGPGAITSDSGNMNTSYTMAYGADPDPYGAVPPYRVAYDTYDPNYPSIPGVANSFAPVAGVNNFTPTAATFQPATNFTENAPTTQPGAMATGSTSDYSYYYERPGINNQRHSMMMTPAPTGMMAQTGTQQRQNAYAPTTMAAQLPQQNPYWMHEHPTYNKYTPDPYAHIKESVYPSPPWKQAPWQPSPWNNSTSSVNPAAAGLGRQADIPLPIGTRPLSNSGQMNKSEPPEEYMRQLRACQDAAIRQHQQQQQQQQEQGPSSRYMMPPSYQQPLPSMSQQTASRRGAGMASWRPAANNNSGSLADEMSRER
ncbi:hypothetical protein LTR91_005678 [Friedmanniomyces endolithicus]|uniref:PSP1 C-terminal domain-containing protein n=1 Tax=Friedmanniomyces endolithicus TaxID=329885 RepID=A0AAN6KUR7_9PEZI|nr:hypothetical protein LTR59_002781 [Friedmanniomyces endolithicus]KAK0811893.1 hypothetical protein LTR75_005061 [Friedmanniomyces endolithicus]KAK0874646.1 hypothetical protein LTS02_000111 [Friedmanniomyces endolithicus]KAK0877179.1 hypothetical protein LTR87_009008 [Friedmanniomyces endolithicus]KAK0975313.1 hypothetical protein LTS01_013859 [Friedmanniomyces endolithicus]